jgi:PleD family two-component response regulator
LLLLGLSCWGNSCLGCNKWVVQGEECFEICSRLKEREQTANTQILVVADSEYLENKHEQFELWSDDFLIKPINVYELRSRVKALLKKKTFLDRLYAGPEGGVRSAITDSLSGLANYSYFKYFLEHEIKRSLRDSRPIALMMMELNDVKHNPNCMGHPAGEEFLKDLGTLLTLVVNCATLSIYSVGCGKYLSATRMANCVPEYFSHSITQAYLKRQETVDFKKVLRYKKAST